MQVYYTPAHKQPEKTSGYKTLGIFFGRMLLIISLATLAMLFTTSRTAASTQDEESLNKSLKSPVKNNLATGQKPATGFFATLRKAI